MKNNKCEKLLNKYLELDKNQRVPFKLTLHLLFCRKCRQQIKVLSMAEKTLSSPLELQTPVTDNSIKEILTKINSEQYKKVQKKSPKKALYLTTGLVLVAIIFSSLNFLGKLNNDDLILAYSWFLATCITAYIVSFIYSNIDIFIKKLSTVVKNIQLNG